ncbi:MAG TPA: MFS transporter, partial [Pseudonocardia sp.]|nr:MFS transporter [Pseudonocardia sp.]
MDRTEPAVHRPALVLGVLSASILLDALDLSITQVALPSIQRDLALPAAALQWVATGYALTYGGFLLLGGRAADLYGRSRVFLGGLVLFGVMSLAAGLAPNALLLVAARCVQGIGAALTVPAAVSIIATTFPEGAQRNRALGVFAASASAGFSVGLVLGGVLTDLLGWPWIFLI